MSLALRGDEGRRLKINRDIHLVSAPGMPKSSLVPHQHLGHTWTTTSTFKVTKLEIPE